MGLQSKLKRRMKMITSKEWYIMQVLWENGACSFDGNCGSDGKKDKMEQKYLRDDASPNDRKRGDWV